MNQRYDAYAGILVPTGLAKIRSTDFTSPLGENILATYLVDRLPFFNARVFDGERTPIGKIFHRVCSMEGRVLAGFTLLSGNAETSFGLAKRFFETGIDVAIGGSEATAYGPRQIMSKRRFIKFGFAGAAEQPLLQLVRGANLNSIPNMTYRDENGSLVQNSYNQSIAQNLDWPGIRADYSLLEDIEKGKGVTYITGNDCFIAQNRCVFCGRVPMGNPKTLFESKTRIENAWKELGQAQSFGIRRFYNSTDSAGVDRGHFLRFAEQKPQNFEIDFHHMFFNAHEVTPEIIPSLRNLNASVYIGIENIALKKEAQKGNISFESHDLKAVSLLEKEKIPMRLSFVLGLPNESEETMQKNCSQIVKLVQDNSMVCDVELNPVEILPGTKLMDLLMSTANGKRFLIQDPPYDTIQMSKAYADEFCRISRSRTIEWINEIYSQVRDIRPDIRVNTKGISAEEFIFLSQKQEEFSQTRAIGQGDGKTLHSLHREKANPPRKGF